MSAAAASSAWARRDATRATLIAQLANMDPYPESVPINNLVQVPGTPLAWHRQARSARIRAHHRLRAHHHAQGAWCGCRPAARKCGDAIQALCFLAGANSIFYGEKLLTTGNPDVENDRALFARLGLHPLNPA